MTLIADQYELEEQIGRGAMGLVYRGRDLDLKTTTVALIEELKTMAAELS